MSDYKPSESKKWWWEENDYNHRDYSYSKGSGSRSWMDKLGSSDDYWKPKKDPNEVYQGLLDQLQKSANLIGDENHGKVVVHWSNGQDVNSVKADKAGDQHIYLSPDDLVSTNGNRSEVSEEILDAMTGKVYLASALRETVDDRAYQQAKVARSIALAKKHKTQPHHACPCGAPATYHACCARKVGDANPAVASNSVKIWEAMETAIARRKIVEDWSGFGPYIASDAERSSATKQEVQDFIDASVEKPSVDAASVAIAWNLLNSSDPVHIPDVYDDCIDCASEMLEEEVDAENRFDTCNEITNRIYKILKTKEEEGGGEGGDDSKGDGESSPEVCDGSMLGEKVENTTDANLADQEGGEEEKKDDDGTPDISAAPPDGCCDLGKNYDLIKVTAQPHHRTGYSEVVSSHRSEIRSIRSSLMFRSNISKLQSFGHRSGDIDENSLFKIRMNDDRVMMKTDTISSKKIAICVLVDESGSMGAGNRVQDARDVAIVLAESLRGMDGIEVSIYGHSAEESHKHQNVTIREYYSPRQKVAACCMEINARAQNHDGYAILHTANIFNRDYRDHERKIMFVVSDGEPAGGGYGGKPAMDHMLRVSQSCQKQGIEVYGVGVDNAYSEVNGKRMYGDNKFVVLHDVKSSLGIMSRFIRQVAMK